MHWEFPGLLPPKLYIKIYCALTIVLTITYLSTSTMPQVQEQKEASKHALIREERTRGEVDESLHAVREGEREISRLQGLLHVRDVAVEQAEAGRDRGKY